MMVLYVLLWCAFSIFYCYSVLRLAIYWQWLHVNDHYIDNDKVTIRALISFAPLGIPVAFCSIGLAMMVISIIIEKLPKRLDKFFTKIGV